MARSKAQARKAAQPKAGVQKKEVMRDASGHKIIENSPTEKTIERLMEMLNKIIPGKMRGAEGGLFMYHVMENRARLEQATAFLEGVIETEKERLSTQSFPAVCGTCGPPSQAEIDYIYKHRMATIAESVQKEVYGETSKEEQIDEQARVAGGAALGISVPEGKEGDE